MIRIGLGLVVAALFLLVLPATMAMAHFMDRPLVLMCDTFPPERCEQLWRDAGRQMRAEDNGFGPVIWARFENDQPDEPDCVNSRMALRLGGWLFDGAICN